MTATRDDWAVAVQDGRRAQVDRDATTPHASWYESMGIVVVWMYNGTGGDDPFVKKVDRPGVLTHGHLPENDNHGGKKTTLKDPRKLAAGPATPGVDISNFLYGDSDLAARKPVPTVRRGSRSRSTTSTPTPKNVWHSITACKAPCTAPPASPTPWPTPTCCSTPAARRHQAPTVTQIF